MKAWSDKLWSGLCQWVRLNLLLLACMVAMRPVFFLEVYFRVGLEPIHFFTILSGAVFDLLLVARICCYGLIPFLLVHWFFPKTARGVAVGLVVAYTVVSAFLSEYYCNLTMPLDHVLLVYTPEELKTTVFSSASLSLAQVLWFLAQMAVPALLLWCWKKVHPGKRFSWITLVLFLLATLLVRYPNLIRKESLYPTHYDFCLAVNQPSYSYVKITDFLRESNERARMIAEDDVEAQAAVEAFQALHPEFEYDTPGYPLYRKATDPDMLGPFFGPTSDGLPPNLVFVIVEGLGQRLTGVNFPQLSFTPFIDSLAAQGLYWPNCLSTAERTFGALPSIFASAPHGRYGFTNPIIAMPRHHSLLLDLERNGYRSAYYYGGDMSFDRYDFFMKTNHVDELFLPQIVVDDSVQYNLLAENNRWGLDDDQLFRHVIAQKQADTTSYRPFVDVYQTLTTHEPFVVDGIEAYEAQVREMVDQASGLTQTERNNILRNQNVYACFLYTDQSLRNLFAWYASRPDFGNTVFVITGDHRMAPVATGNALRKYNVPLVVYSPLLKRHKTMNAVVSHLDVTPSLNAFLHANYDYAIDDHCHWIGTSFDTASVFQNTRQLAFILNNRDIVEYLNGREALCSGKLLLEDSLFVGHPVEDGQRLQAMQTELDHLNLVERYVVQNDLLMPHDANTILYDAYLDFEQHTLQVFDKYTVRREGYLSIGNDIDYLSLCSNIAVRPIYGNVMVELSFDIRNLDPSRELPLLTIALGSDEKRYRLETLSGESLNTGQWEHFHLRNMLNTMEVEHTEALKLYLWNHDGTEYHLDNLVITVEGETGSRETTPGS